MADFQVPKNIINNIKEYFSLPHTNEPCGAICVVKGKFKFYPLSNESEIADTFSPNPIQYTRIVRNLFMLVHGHDDNCIPSEHDILQCNVHGIPYLIFNLQNYEYSVQWPTNYTSLTGKQYKFGVNDCFEAARKWYLLHEVPIDPRKHWVDDWWDLGLTYIEDEVSNWGFVPTNTLEYGNLITFAMDSEGISNHLGVYIDNDEFFHHAANRLSCIENLYPIWGPCINGIYKYENSDFRGFSRR